MKAAIDVLEKILKRLEDEAFQIDLHFKQGIYTEKQKIQKMFALSLVVDRVNKLKNGMASFKEFEEFVG